jgi:hypothetical protein
MHMIWQKQGERENNNVMVHPSDGEAWKALDNFDLHFARDAKKCSHQVSDRWFHSFH